MSTLAIIIIVWLAINLPVGMLVGMAIAFGMGSEEPDDGQAPEYAARLPALSPPGAQR